MSDRSRLQSSKYWKTYTSFVADINLRTDGPAGAAATDNLKLDCREILCVSGGVLVLKRPDGTTDTTPTLAPGTYLPVQAKTIVSSGTTATSVIVFW